MKRILVLIAAVFFLASPVAHSDVDATRATLREHVLKLINRDRQLYGLQPVRLDLATSAMGDDYCREQIRTGTNGHYGIDGRPPYMRYSFAGGNDGVSENAAAWSANYAFSDRALYEMARRSQDAMMAEMAPNDGHRKTILDPHATHVGIGLAWERGEFRLVQEFVRRYVEWTRPVPRHARTGDTVTISGRPLDGATIDAISVHFEKPPATMPASVANALESYSLPRNRKDYLPRLPQHVTRTSDGGLSILRQEYADGRRGDFPLSSSGGFSFAVPFTEGPGVYTVVVWVRRGGTSTPVAASNISIAVTDGVTSPVVRSWDGARAGRYPR